MEKKKKGFVRRIPSIIGILICLVLVPILVMNITIIAKSYINPDEVPDFMGIKPFIVLTGSMEGAIDAGDLVITQVVDPETLEVGDIISYLVGESVITHRIVDLTEVDGERTFITQGDVNNVADEEPVTYSQVESIYMFRIPKLGSLGMFMQTPVGMLVFIGIPLCCFIIYDVIRRQIYNKKAAKLDEAKQAEIDRLKEQLESQVKQRS